MNLVRACLILICAASFVSCTKGKPDFQMISEDAIPRPLFNGNSQERRTIKPIITDNPSTPFQIEGECDPKISSIQGLAIGGSNSQISNMDFFASSVSITCSSDGKFSFQLKSLTDLGFSPILGNVYVIELRGVTVGGVSRPSLIRITFSNAVGGQNQIMVTSGGTGANLMVNQPGNDPAHGYSAQVRVGYKQNSDGTHIKQGPGANPRFKAQVGIRLNGPAAD